MWKEDFITVDGQRLMYGAKVYDEGSSFGLNGGRVSELQVVTGTSWALKDTILHFDRGCWDIEPTTELAKKALAFILELYQ